MLSKSQAKSFFIIGTAAFSAIFIGLTIDTFQRIPDQTKQNELSESAIRGKHLFDKKNCMGCHTILGEGAYYAPELTKVIERRGESFVKAILKDPEAMYPGQRKMVNYHFTDEEILDLTNFLKWIGNMDLNGFPAKPDLLQTSPSNSKTNESMNENEIVAKKPAIFDQMCTACHMLNSKGGQVGPALDQVGSKFDREYILKWLKDPMSVKADSKMPKLPLSDQDITELAEFLSSLKGDK